MKLILVKPYLMFPAGAKVDFDKPIADLLIMRKIAEPEKEETKKKFLRVKDATNQQAME